MPLVDHRQFKGNNKGADQIIEVVIAVVSSIEYTVIEGRITTELQLDTRLVVTMEINKSLERLHTNNGEGVI